MKASELLIGIVFIFSLASIFVAMAILLGKGSKILTNGEVAPYGSLKREFCYKYVNIRDILKLVGWSAFYIIFISTLGSIMIITLQYIGDLNIKEYSNKENNNFIELFATGIISMMVPFLIKLLKDAIVYSIISIRVIIRFIVQKKYPSRSDVQFYKCMNELLQPWLSGYDREPQNDIKTVRSKIIDDMSDTIDQLIKEGRTVRLNHDMIEDLTLISFRVDNHKLLDTLELAYVKSLGYYGIHINWISKMFKVNGLGEHQQSKTFNYFPVKAII